MTTSPADGTPPGLGSPPSLRIVPLVSAPFMENTWLVLQKGDTRAVVIDPGFQPQQVIEFLEREGATPEVLLATHGHVDHIAGISALRQRWPDAPIVIGVGDAAMLTDPRANLSGLAGAAITSPPADRLVREGDVVEAAGLRFEVRDIPGHSPGHVVYILTWNGKPLVFGGDVLFDGSIGRCDFPGGNQRQLVQGIRDKLFVLDDDTRVYPGHGPATTIGRERASNPFCGDGAR